MSSFFNITKAIRILLHVVIVNQLMSCADSKDANENSNDYTQDSTATTIHNPVLPGDFADPSVVRVGDDYWATATSSEWAPLFPLLHSKNLKDWKIEDHVFPDDLPAWAEAHFWAPEIAYDDGRYYIYYTAKKKDGPLCVGVASSENPSGPYRDHGPIVCQEAGAIDGFQIRDDEGRLFLIWKEDGNSIGEPTPMWGQEMNEERTELVGDRFELFRNDPDTWEGNLVEGAYLLKKNGYYYTFYSADACCGRECTYGIGVARAKDLRGPWKKYEKNPIKQENEKWKCAGHGSMVRDGNGRYFFLYHAYSKEGTVYTGRQGLISEVVWREDGWPEFKASDSGQITKTSDSNQDLNIQDNFHDDELSKSWQWPVGNKPTFSLEDNLLVLESKPNQLGAVLAQRIFSPDYIAVTAIEIPQNTGGSYGLAAIGDQENAIGVSVSGNDIVLWKVQRGNEETIAKANPSEGSAEIQLKMTVMNGEGYSFSWSQDGENWNEFNEDNTLNGSFLPPWDRAVRVGLVSKGSPGNKGIFKFFEVAFE